MNFLENARQARLVRKEEKEENVTRFLGYYLDRLSVSEAPDPTERIATVIARSPRSPVARSIMALAPELRDQDLLVKVVFAKLDPADALAGFIDLAVPATSEKPLCMLRWARNPALIDAHEQLVLGSAMCWLGDSMRREPENRDAYELFETCNGEIARRTSLSFRALWEASASVPFSRFRTNASGLGHEVDLSDTNPVAELMLGRSTTTASTRH
ncbi:MAG: hypothetical protein R3D33_13215 [Hyphomicrobiaceae bacterium]